MTALHCFQCASLLAVHYELRFYASSVGGLRLVSSDSHVWSERLKPIKYDGKAVEKPDGREIALAKLACSLCHLDGKLVEIGILEQLMIDTARTQTNVFASFHANKVSITLGVLCKTLTPRKTTKWKDLRSKMVDIRDFDFLQTGNPAQRIPSKPQTITPPEKPAPSSSSTTSLKLIDESLTIEDVVAAIESNTYTLTRTIPRNYQIELFIECLKAPSSLASLPTGAGKTLIAAMLIRRMLALNPGKTAVFLVDRVPLAFQQAHVLEYELSACGEPPEVLCVAGSLIKRTNRSMPLSAHRIIVAVAAAYINLLASRQLDFSDVCMVVFDEVHHIGKSHSFKQLLVNYVGIEPARSAGPIPPPKVKLIGLSASPAGDPDPVRTLQLVLERVRDLANARIVTARRYAEEMASYINQPEVRLVTCGFSELERKLDCLLKEYTERLVEECYVRAGVMNVQRSARAPQSYGSLTSGNGGSVKHDAGDEQQPVQRASDERVILKANYRNKRSRPLLLTHTMQILKVHADLEDCGLFLALEGLTHILQSVLSVAEEGSATTATSDKMNTAFDWLSPELRSKLRPIVTFIQRYKTDEHKLMDASTKLRCLVDELQRITSTMESDVKVIVFVEKRRRARMLGSVLQKHFGLTDTAVIVGHGTRKLSTSDGMTLAEQATAVECFRSGKAKILVATSVVEEGFDVPVCNAVIRFDMPSSVTALVQSRGRVRARNGEMTAIVRGVSGDLQLRSLLASERNMKFVADILAVGSPEALQHAIETLRKYDSQTRVTLLRLWQSLESSNEAWYAPRIEYQLVTKPNTGDAGTEIMHRVKCMVFTGVPSIVCCEGTGEGATLAAAEDVATEQALESLLRFLNDKRGTMPSKQKIQQHC